MSMSDIHSRLYLPPGAILDQSGMFHTFNKAFVGRVYRLKHAMFCIRIVEYILRSPLYLIVQVISNNANLRVGDVFFDFAICDEVNNRVMQLNRNIKYELETIVPIG